MSARGHPQLRLQVLVDDVADADGRDDFEEVGGQASVEPRRALVLQDLPEEPRHRHLLAAPRRRCKTKIKTSVSDERNTVETLQT